MICFKCRSCFSSIDKLIFHLKTFHNLKTNDVYTCVGSDCGQRFNNISSYKRHLRRLHCEHIEANASPCSISSIEISQQKKEYSQSLNNNTKDITAFNENEALMLKDANAELSVIEESFMCSMTLHNKNNLNRKDVLDIQESISKVTKKIALIF